MITYNILYRQDNGEKIHAHKNFTGYYKNQESDEMVHTIRSRFTEQRNPMHTCINRLINGFKILIQLLKLVAAKDLAGRRYLGEGCWVSTGQVSFSTLFPWEGGGVETDTHMPPV